MLAFIEDNLFEDILFSFLPSIDIVLLFLQNISGVAHSTCDDGYVNEDLLIILTVLVRKYDDNYLHPHYNGKIEFR